jgi:hypothetical protein
MASPPVCYSREGCTQKLHRAASVLQPAGGLSPAQQAGLKLASKIIHPVMEASRDEHFAGSGSDIDKEWCPSNS